MSPVSYPKTPSERLLQANWELSAAMERGGLRSIMETAGRIFSCPLILVDEHFRIIDSCPKDPEAIPELRCMVRNCCLNERVIWQVLKEHTSGDTFSIDHRNRLCSWISLFRLSPSTVEQRR